MPETANAKLLDLKKKIDALSPAARLLMASQLVARGDYMAVEVGMQIVENTVLEWKAAKLLARQAEGR